MKTTTTLETNHTAVNGDVAWSNLATMTNLERSHL